MYFVLECLMDSYIKYICKRFDVAKLKYWAKKRYYDSEMRHQEEVYNAYVNYFDYIKNNKSEQAENINNEYKFDFRNYIIWEMVKNFTLKPTNVQNLEILISILNEIGINFIINENELSILDDNLNFYVMRFSEVEPNILHYLKDIEKSSRAGKCHPYSVLTAKLFDSNQEFTTQFVTGQVYHLSEKSSYMHSWVEVFDGENECVIDPAKNVFMLKKPYYEINHVKEIQKINSSEIVQDYEMIRNLASFDNYLVKVYYENADNGRFLYQTLLQKGIVFESQPKKEN